MIIIIIIIIIIIFIIIMKSLWLFFKLSPFIGAQAVMEMFFSRFVFVCSGSKSKSLGTIAVNVFIGLNQLTALSGGLLADYVLGNYHTQNMSNIMGTVGILLIFLSSWQYSLNKPHCCVPELNISANIPSSCHELDKHQILKSFSLSIPPDVTVVLIIIGCVVSLIELVKYSVNIFHHPTYQTSYLKMSESTATDLPICHSSMHSLGWIKKVE